MRSSASMHTSTCRRRSGSPANRISRPISSNYSMKRKVEMPSCSNFMKNLQGSDPDRPAGRQLRTKCINLLNAEPGKPLLLDWSGVPLVSSSFADELIGKLFASLGPLAFSARVRNVNMEAVVRGLVDKAIMQRAAQTANGMGGVDHPLR